MIKSDDIFDILFAKDAQEESNIPLQHEYIGPVQVINSTDTTLGRSLIVTRDVCPGELLFVSSPLLRANVDQARQLWFDGQTSNATDNGFRETCFKSLHEISETVLVDECRTCNDVTVLKSCLSLVGSVHSKPSQSAMDVIVGRNVTSKADGDSDIQEGNQISADEWKQIIRRNAFGSDFITSDYIEDRWRVDMQTYGNNLSSWFQPKRLLGLYPLASMINHSCVPNAVRVFVNQRDDKELMIVHACQNIPKGNEVVWSYIPVIDSYPIRLKTLKSTHNFVCQCTRCKAEAHLWKTNECLINLHKNVTKLLSSTTSSALEAITDTEIFDSFQKQIHCLEYDLLLSTNLIISSRNEEKRYLRVGFFRLYSLHLNTSLLRCQNLEQAERLKIKYELFNVSSQLHFSLAACHNASTEHISVSYSTKTISNDYFQKQFRVI
jgi:SET domain